MTNDTISPLSFYETVDRESIYTIDNDCQDHPFFPLLVPFLDRCGLADKKCLEIGSSKGLFQDLVQDYTGVDVAEHLADRYHKPYVVVANARLPFPDSHFDAVFTYATHEHIPEIELSLEEIVRVLKPGGVCLFAPAWHSRPWFAEGLAVRHYRDLTLKQKLRKLSIPVRDFLLVRWPLVLARRLWRLRKWRSPQPVELSYRRLDANYEQFWQADSDACNSLDPFDVIIWFKSRGFVCRGYKQPLAALFARTYALDLQKPAR